MFNELLENVMNLGIITADDVARLTSIELMLLIIKRINGLLERTNQIDEKYMQITEQIKQDIETYRNELSDDTIRLLNEWINDGTFSALINQNVLGEVNGRIDATNSMLAVERMRIDEIVTLPEGSTTGDAELMDGRVDSFGITHANIGGCIRSESEKVNEILGITVEYGQNAIDDGSFKNRTFNQDFVDQINQSNLYFPVFPAFEINDNTKLMVQLYFADGSTITGNPSNVVEFYRNSTKLTYYGLGSTTQPDYPVTGVTKIKVKLDGDNSEHYDKTVQGICMKLSSVGGYVDFKKEYHSTLKNEIIEALKPGSDLPSYYESYLDTKIAELKDVEGEVGANGDSFIFITDYHAPSNQGHSPAIIKRICDELHMNQVIFGGDILNEVMDGTQLKQLSDFMKLFDHPRFRAIIGNHDYNTYGGEANKLTNNQVYPIMIKPSEVDCLVIKESAYGYDNKSQKIRYVFLNSKDNFDIDENQQNFLRNQISSVDASWGIVIIVHAFYSFLGIDDRTCSSTRAVGTKVLNIIDTTDGGKVICVMTGDSHIDQAKQYDKGYWVIGTTCDANGGQASSGSTDIRLSETVNEQALDVVFIDTANKKIICKRIGGGIGDRTFNYR